MSPKERDILYIPRTLYVQLTACTEKEIYSSLSCDLQFMPSRNCSDTTGKTPAQMHTTEQVYSANSCYIFGLKSSYCHCRIAGRTIGAVFVLFIHFVSVHTHDSLCIHPNRCSAYCLHGKRDLQFASCDLQFMPFRNWSDTTGKTPAHSHTTEKVYTANSCYIFGLKSSYCHRRIDGRTIGAVFVLFIRWMNDLMQLNKGGQLLVSPPNRSTHESTVQFGLDQ